MNRFIHLAVWVAFCAASFAIVPPKSSVKAPENFKQLKKRIASEYKEGYFANKFAERKHHAQMLSKGVSPKIALAADTVHAITLLGRYSDATPIYSAEAFQKHLFDGPNPTGTVTDYFWETSYGQLYFTGSCAGWFNMPRKMSEYVGDNNGLGTSGGPRFTLELVKAADSTMNFADYIQYYDGSGNPRIGFIAVVHSGSDAASGGNNIWSHRWNFRMVNGNKPYTTNDIDPVSGKYVLIDGDYAIQSELEGSSNFNGPIKSIGVFAHEFGHIFGLPDLYDTDNSSEGLGNWCLMAGGSYGGNGATPETPVHLSAWAKQELGWVVPITVTSQLRDLEIPNVEENQVIYKLWKKDQPNSNEYFLVEHRDWIGFDSHIYIPGLLIYHIDDNLSTNTNEDHPLIDVEQADGLRNLNLGQNRGDAGDPFPGTSKNTTFDFLSKPKSTSYSNENTFVSVRNIHRQDPYMVATLDVGTVPFVVIDQVSVKENIAGNGRVEQGEIGDLELKFRNIESVNSLETKFSFSFDDPEIELLAPEYSVSVNANSLKDASVTTAFRIKPEFVSKMLYLKYRVESEGNDYSDSIKITFGIPEALVVSKTSQNNLFGYYDTVLTALGYTIEEVENKNIAELLSDRKLVVYFSGKTLDSMFTAAEIDSLTSFINSGGHLLLSGQNLPEYLEKNYESFLADELEVDWVKSGNIFAYRNVYGIPSDVIGNQIPYFSIWGSEGAQNETSPDIISSLGNFNLSFSYKENTTEGAGGWIEKSSGAKIILLGFGFESISNPESDKSRDQIMQILTDWLNTVSSVDDHEVPFSFDLAQNYPNPFNPSTKIRFTVPASTNGTQKILLKIYDVLGNEVSTLINEELSPGIYEKEFNAVNNSGASLASGVYYYQLKMDNLVQTKKMMVLK